MKNLKDIRQSQTAPVITEATTVEKLHAASLDASAKAKASPSALNHKAAADAHEKAMDSHEKTINSLIKKGGSSEEVKKHEAHIKMHKNEAQKHRFAAHRLAKAQQNEETVTEAKFKVTFVHQHPEGEKKHDYVVSATHQNAADQKAIGLHQKAHPTGDFDMWDSQKVSEGLEDACWKGYEAIGMKMKDGKKVPNCVPKEAVAKVSVDRPIGYRIADIGPGGKEHNVQTKDWPSNHAVDARTAHQAAHVALKKGDIETYHKEMDKKFTSHQAASAEASKKPVKTYEDTTTIEKPVAEDSDDKNLRISKHEKMAVEAAKRGDKHAQQFHLDKVNKLKNESVNEATKSAEPKKHLVTVTVTDPQHPAVSKRKEKIMKRVKVSATDPKEAVKKAEAHYKKHGFKVHDSLHHSVVQESLDTDEFIDSYDPEHDRKETEEIQMARAQLREIADMAQDLVDAMEDDDQLEPWMQYKITSANKDLDDVHSTVAYGEDDDSKAGSGTQNEAVDEPDETSTALSPEEAAQIAKIKTLIRLGLLDNSEMQITLRAVKKLDLDQPVTSSAERQAINTLVQKLIGVVTGDDTVFRKIRLNVQK